MERANVLAVYTSAKVLPSNSRRGTERHCLAGGAGTLAFSKLYASKATCHVALVRSIPGNEEERLRRSIDGV